MASHSLQYVTLLHAQIPSHVATQVESFIDSFNAASKQALSTGSLHAANERTPDIAMKKKNLVMVQIYQFTTIAYANFQLMVFANHF